MRAQNLQPGDRLVARYVSTATTRQSAGHRSGDKVRTGSFVPVRERVVTRVSVAGDTAHLVLDGKIRTGVAADTVFEIVRNGEVL